MNHKAGMKPLVGSIVFCAATISTSGAATTESKDPEREIVKMMEFLRQMDMIKQLEMLRDMQHLENAGAQPKITAPQKTTPGTKKEAVK